MLMGLKLVAVAECVTGLVYGMSVAYHVLSNNN